MKVSVQKRTLFAAQPFSILVVDDFPSMVKMIRHLLQELGYTNTYGANDGDEALQTVRRCNYDLVISDLGMPKMDGMTLLREIRADMKTRDLPFIMLTATNEHSRVAEAKLAGVTDYIVKPFTMATLKAKMATTFGRPSQKPSDGGERRVDRAWPRRIGFAPFPVEPITS
jgi:two-component system chemotaxis response regulator CheY